MQKFIDKWRYEILAGALPGICNRGLIQRLETTSNDLIPDFDRFSRRLSRFYSPNLGDLQKKRLQFFFLANYKILTIQKILLFSSRGQAFFEDLRLRGQGLQNVSSRPMTSSRTPPLLSSTVAVKLHQ